MSDAVSFYSLFWVIAFIAAVTWLLYRYGNKAEYRMANNCLAPGLNGPIFLWTDGDTKCPPASDLREGDIVRAATPVGVVAGIVACVKDDTVLLRSKAHVIYGVYAPEYFSIRMAYALKVPRGVWVVRDIRPNPGKWYSSGHSGLEYTEKATTSIIAWVKRYSVMAAYVRNHTWLYTGYREEPEHYTRKPA